MTALVDSACGYAALTTMAEDREVLTVDFSANFVAPAAGERFRATATVLRAGRTIVVTRGGRRIAVIGPAPTAPGRMVRALLNRHREALDAGFEADVAAARESSGDEMRATWPDA